MKDIEWKLSANKNGLANQIQKCWDKMPLTEEDLTAVISLAVPSKTKNKSKSKSKSKSNKSKSKSKSNKSKSKTNPPSQLRLTQKTPWDSSVAERHLKTKMSDSKVPLQDREGHQFETPAKHELSKCAVSLESFQAMVAYNEPNPHTHSLLLLTLMPRNWRILKLPSFFILPVTMTLPN